MARRKKLKLEVTDKNAVYVNGTRITGRDTKWGIHRIVFSTKVFPEDVVQTLKDLKFEIPLDKEYAAEFGIIV